VKRALCVSLDAVVGAGAVGRLPGRLTAAATLAELAGADRIRIGVREDLAPVGLSELRDLRRCVRQLELRIAPVPALVRCALEVRPERVLLASELAAGHAAGPLDVPAWSASLAGVLRTLRDAGIDAALAVAPTLDAVKAARGVEALAVELATAALVDLPPRERRDAYTTLGDAARLAAKLRVSAGAGGGLDLAALGAVLESAPSLEWVSAGRGLVERALLVGLERSVRDWRERI
jgi:pyridoxine 5'-phosphate synthase PdxJ